jgi:uncharacterized protein (DUF1697 family)
MTHYAALLRGINVGGRNRIAMADLRELLAALGYTGVRTHLQSGNAVFDAPAQPEAELARRIGQALLSEAGLNARCLIRDAAALRAVVEANPLADVATDGSKLLVLFLSSAPDPNVVTAADPRALAQEHIALGDRVIYQWCPDGVRNAPQVSAFVEKHWQVDVTARNQNTLTKLAGMLPE